MFLNLVDVLIIGVLVYFAVQGYRSGFLAVIAQLISFVGSLFIALRSYSFIAGLLREHFMISLPVSNAVGFLIAAVVSELILGLALYFIIERIPPKVLRHSFWKVLGVFPSMIEGLVISAFVLTFTMALPIQPRYKEAISNSKIGNEIVTRTMHVELAMREVFGDVIDDTLTYLTIRPQSTEVVNLNTQVGELSIDENAETEMYKMVNQERLKEGAEELEWDPNLVPPARAHARDMWERQYFSHVSPDGKDVGDRLQEHNVRYFLAGENLALAPTLNTAHEGLMNSPGHRANILEKNFRRIGIGVIDNGVYGKMFVQVFAD